MKIRFGVNNKRLNRNETMNNKRQNRNETMNNKRQK